MKKIYINPGHSDKDPGAVGYETERQLNVKVTQYMNEYLLANYVCEIRTNPGTMGSLTEICKDANDWGADLFVSNHFNAGKGDGYEALVYNQKRVPLGKVFEKYVLEAGQNSRGVKIRPDLAVLKNTNMPAVLNEGAFVDNLKDIQDWNEDAELKKLGIAYAKAVAEYLELEKKPIVEEPKPVSANLPTLSKGSKGKSVKALQVLLIGYAYSCGASGADGDFGSATDKALRAFQKDMGLSVDGVCGPNTWNKLLGVS